MLLLLVGMPLRLVLLLYMSSIARSSTMTMTAMFRLAQGQVWFRHASMATHTVATVHNTSTLRTSLGTTDVQVVAVAMIRMRRICVRVAGILVFCLYSEHV